MFFLPYLCFSLKLGLASSAKITIYHQATKDGPKFVLHQAFPKDLAIAFSTYMSRAFNAVPLSQISLSQLTPRSESTVVIKGGRLDIHREVLDWILACGKAGKTVTFRWLQVPAFYNYSLVLLSCEKLGVNVLQGQIQARMRDIAVIQVHSVDVERVFSFLSGPHPLKDMVCQSIGQAMFDGRLKAFGAYKALFEREEYRGFKEGTDAVYEKLDKQFFKTPEGKIAKKEQEAREQQCQEKREAAKGRREQNFKRAAARRHNVDPSRITPAGEGQYTVTTDGRRVRKGQGGRPGFVQLDLGQMGINPRQFRAADFPALPPKVNKNASSSGTPATASEKVRALANAKETASDGKVKTSDTATSADVELSTGMKGMDLDKK